ncbi:MAG: hypothetical protein LBE67_11705 [Kocuria palustris]|nr:hypothetical protein [Kocuria palustris]
MDDSSPWWNAPRRSRLVPDRRRGTAAGSSCDDGAVDEGHALLGASRCFPAMLMRVSARDLLGIRRPHG